VKVVETVDTKTVTVVVKQMLGFYKVVFFIVAILNDVRE